MTRINTPAELDAIVGLNHTVTIDHEDLGVIEDVPLTGVTQHGTFWIILHGVEYALHMSQCKLFTKEA